MNKKYLVGTAILGGVGLFAYSIYYYIRIQTELLKNFTYLIRKVKLTTFNSQIIKGIIQLDFTNNSDVEVAINEFYLDFFLNGDYIGYLQDTSPFVILKRSTTPISFEFTLNPQLILSNVVSIATFSLKARDAVFSLKGKAKLKSGFVKATLPVTYETTIKEILS